MNVNRNIPHPSAFISSTFADLEMERKAVADVLSRANIYANALDIKPASNNSSQKEIFKGIINSDFIIVIVGARYGTLNKRITKRPEFSITKWEYFMARQHAKDALVFFKEIKSPLPEQMDDDDSDFYRKRELLKRFKKELSDTHNPKPFRTPDGLAKEVEKALVPMYREGLIELLNRRDELEKEVGRLRPPTKANLASSLGKRLIDYGLPVSPANALAVPSAKDPQMNALNALRGMYDSSFNTDFRA